MTLVKKVHMKLSMDHKISAIKPIQLPTKCQLCTIRTRVKWKCYDCDRFVCATCEKVHQKLSKDHQILNINDIREDETEDTTKITFKVVKQYTIDTAYIYDIAVSHDGSMWIGDNKSQKLILIRLYSDDSATVLSLFNIKQYSLAISPSGPPFIVVNNISALCIVNELIGNIDITDSKFTIHP